MIPTLVVISIVCFVLIQLPPGDFLTALTAELAETGDEVDEAVLNSFRQQYGLDRPSSVSSCHCIISK